MEVLHFSYNNCKPSKFGSEVAHLDLDGEVSGLSPGHNQDKTLKMVLTAPQPVLVIMSLIKGMP